MNDNLILKHRPKTLWRLPLWVAFLGFTIAVLLYPVNFRLETFIVQSPDIFPNLPLFGTIFFLWTVSLVVLVITPAKTRALWERLSLVIIADLVIRGFWSIIAPIQHQSLLHAQQTKSWLDTGQIIHQQGYSTYPGLSLTTASIYQITGLELFPSITIQTVFIDLVIAIGSFLFLLKILKSTRLASLACLLVIAGSPWLWSMYFPWTMGMAFMMLFIMTLFHQPSWGNRPRSLVAFLLFVAITITHVFGAILTLCITCIVLGFGVLRRNQAESWVSITAVLLFSVILIAWHLYFFGSEAFTSMTEQAYLQITAMPFWQLLSNLLSMGQSQAEGGSTPLWISMPRLVWEVLLYAAGGLLWLGSLRRFRRLNVTESKLTAVAFGLLLTTGALFVFVKGASDLRRPLLYGSFLLIPFLFLSLQKFKPVLKRVSLAGLAFVLVFLSLPSFLGNNLHMPSWTFYDTEYASGEWMQYYAGRDRELHVFSTVPVYWTIKFYIPDTYRDPSLPQVAYHTEINIMDFENWGADTAWQILFELPERYYSSSQKGNYSVFVNSPKTALYQSPIYNIAPDDIRWIAIVNRLAEGSNNIYNNGPIRIFLPFKG